MQRAAMQQRGLGTQGKLSCLRSAPLLAPRLADARATRHPRRATTASAAPSNGHADERGPDYSSVQRNLALELVRVTEAAALASGRWLGKGDKNAADQAAVDMMRKVLNSVHMRGVVVIGEGAKDEAPMLYCGEEIGDGGGMEMDIAVDPLDGTTLTAQGRNGAVSVIALASRGSLFDPGPVMYMEKLAVGPQVPPDSVSLDWPVAQNLQSIANALDKPISEVTVLMLDRPRHADLLRQCREAGARIRLISDGDVGGAIETAKPGAPVDVLMGIGGTPEGVIAACALKCMGGSLQGRLWPRNEEERKAALELGYELNKVLHIEDLCKGDDIFFAATGVSDGDLLKGVRYVSGGASTNSIVMRCKSGTVRFVETYHKWAKPSVTNPIGITTTEAHSASVQPTARDMASSTRRMGTVVYEALITSGAAAGSMVALAAAAFIPVQTYLQVEQVKKDVEGLKTDMLDVKAGLARIEALLQPKKNYFF